LILCSRQISEHGSWTAGNRGLRVAEHVGVGGPDDAPAPAVTAEQIGAALPDLIRAMRCCQTDRALSILKVLGIAVGGYGVISGAVSDVRRLSE
jgi:hypothetical protein